MQTALLLPSAVDTFVEKTRWVSSYKIDKTMEILEDIRARKPKEKTLVFRMWTSFLDLLEIPIKDAGIKYTRYDGSMRPGVRELMKLFGV